MKPDRLNAFTDGVIAIIITIMVLEIRVPAAGNLEAVKPVLPILGAYALSFVNVGIFWSNHHHMLQSVRRVNGAVLWANLFLLFSLSLVPFVIRWMDEAGFASLPVAAYGFVLGMSAVGYLWLQHEIIRMNGGPDSRLAHALGNDWKGRLSLISYFIAAPLAFVQPLIAVAVYVIVAGVWLVPDRRIEHRLPAKPADRAG